MAVPDVLFPAGLPFAGEYLVTLVRRNDIPALEEGKTAGVLTEREIPKLPWNRGNRAKYAAPFESFQAYRRAPQLNLRWLLRACPLDRNNWEYGMPVPDDLGMLLEEEAV